MYVARHVESHNYYKTGPNWCKYQKSATRFKTVEKAKRAIAKDYDLLIKEELVYFVKLVKKVPSVFVIKYKHNDNYRYLANYIDISGYHHLVGNFLPDGYLVSHSWTSDRSEAIEFLTMGEAKEVMEETELESLLDVHIDAIPYKE